MTRWRRPSPPPWRRPLRTGPGRRPARCGQPSDAGALLMRPPRLMRAVVCNALTGIDGLALEQRPDPGQPGPREVRIKIAAAGLNYADLLVTTGKYQVKHEPPFIPGFEAAGTIEAVGSGVTEFKPGDAVMAIPEAGSYAEAAILPVERVYAAPGGLDHAGAAGFPIAYGTSYLALVEQARL